MQKVIFPKINRNHIIFFIAIITTILLINYNFHHGERVPQNHGYGWDGVNYASWAQAQPLSLFGHNLSEFYVGRILPSLVVHGGGNFINFDISTHYGVIQAFYVYNYALMIGVAVFMFLIGRQYNWSMQVYFIGYCALFINYNTLKMYSYYPLLTDPTAFFMGIAIYYFHITNRLKLLVITSFLSVFVWPTILYGSIVLIIFGKTKVAYGKPPLYGKFLAGIIVICFIVWAIVGYFYGVYNAGRAPFNKPFLIISIILLITYMYYSICDFIDIKAIVNSAMSSKLNKVVIGLLLLIIAKYTVYYLSNGQHGPQKISYFIPTMIQESLKNPLINVVTYTNNFGPYYLIILLMWKRVVSLVKNEGLGMVMYIGMFAFLSLCCEARELINAWPVFVILLCQVINKADKNPPSWFFAYSMGLSSLILSRFWLKLNIDSWVSTSSLMDFPKQMWFMSSGPWTSNSSYLVFLAITIFAAILVTSLLKLDLLMRRQYCT
jgi:hypothetical protein